MKEIFIVGTTQIVPEETRTQTLTGIRNNTTVLIYHNIL
jgi:hypothetical protein